MDNRSATSRRRAAVQMQASRPRRDGVLGELLDNLVVHMTERGLPASSALAEAGRTVAGTSWAGYRNGRNRLATMAAAYLHWIAPDDDWRWSGTLEVASRRPVVWAARDGRSIVDLLDVDGSGQKLVTATFATAKRDASFAGVRLVRMQAPMTSLMYTSPTNHAPLAQTTYWFGNNR